MTATEASRNRDARRRTGADLRAALVGIPAPDDRFGEEMAAAVALLETDGRLQRVRRTAV